MNKRNRVGKVVLVGAGPGDPELLTLKAVRALQEADVVLVDDLVSDEVVAHANDAARIIRVGKRGGCASTPQVFIDRLMIQEAHAGHRVVRLKGGDPMVFGRGGEEIEALRAAGIEIDVVNGITAGLAAASGLQASLTHRDLAHGVVFVTGHAKPGDQALDWAELAAAAHRAKLSLVVYMGISGIEEIAQGLLRGLPRDTISVVVQAASTVAERRHVTTLIQLAQDVREHALGSPSVLLIGDAFRAASSAAASGSAAASESERQLFALASAAAERHAA
jgi:uroporphyrin-III C-methyltransferase